MALFVTLFLGIFFLFGMLVIKYAPNHERIEHMSFAIAFGAMVGLMCLDLLPEMLEEFHGVFRIAAALLVAVGVGLLMMLDLFIPEHEEADEENPVHIGIMATIAIVLHNLIEGMTVYSVCLSGLSSGMALGIGVGLHNIPMGMLIYSSLKTESKGKRYLLMALATFSTFMGGLTMMALSILSPDLLMKVLLCLTMGMILYIVVFELRPLLLRSNQHALNAIGIVIGLAVVVLSSTMLE